LFAVHLGGQTQAYLEPDLLQRADLTNQIAPLLLAAVTRADGEASPASDDPVVRAWNDGTGGRGASLSAMRRLVDAALVAEWGGIPAGDAVDTADGPAVVAAPQWVFDHRIRTVNGPPQSHFVSRAGRFGVLESASEPVPAPRA
jgi:hypothetical protein